MLKITPAELKSIAQYIHDISGIYLDQSKSYLFETRLSSIAEELGCSSYLALYDKARRDPGKIIERQIIDAISTMKPFFFRDNGPFELLKHKILPEIIDLRTPSSPRLKTNIKIWSAASSTGQELYSVAMTIKDLIGTQMDNFNFKLLGTDISDNVVKQASYGKYNKFEIERGLPRPTLQKHFTLFGDSWKVKDELRAMVNFAN